jgi:hypothetical protein
MALPGDINSTSAPGDPDQKDRGGQVEDARPDDVTRTDDATRADNATGQSDQAPGGLPGLPKLFFAAEDLQGQRDADQPEAGQQNGRSPQTSQADRPVLEPQGSFGQPSRPPLPSQQRRPGGPVQRPPARPGRPDRAQPTKQPDRELRHRALASLVLGVLALVALLGLGGDLHRGVYLLIFSAVVGIGSCIIGITAVIKARKTGSYRPRGSIGGIVLGALAAVLSIPILATYLAFPHQVDNYVKCLNQNQGSGSEQSCMDKFYKSIHVGAITVSRPDNRATNQRS